MIRRSRVAAAIALGVLLLGGLAACRADPDAAAYVGEVKILVEQVDTIMDEQVRDLVARDVDQRAAQTFQSPELTAEQQATRDGWLAEALARLESDTVMALVVNEIGRQYAAANDIELPEPSPGAVADQLQMPADHPFVAVLSEHYAVVNAFRQQVQPVEPTEDDQREVYDNLQLGGQPPPMAFEELQPSLDVDAIGPQVALRNLVRDLVAESDIVINPRYTPMYPVPVQVMQAQSTLMVPLDPTDPAVVDSEPVIEAEPAAADPQG